jgi:hypothetical protein
MEIPFKYMLDKLGLGLRACYMDVLREREPAHLKPLIDRLLGRETAEPKRGTGAPSAFKRR